MNAEQLSESLAAAVDAASPAVVRLDARRRHAATAVVWSEGTLVTALHVLERESDLPVGLPDGSTVTASLRGADPALDLAVLDAPGVPAGPAWHDAARLKVGHLALALARPGRGVRAAISILTRVGEAWRTPQGGQVDVWLETDLGGWPGYSGSPLVDAAGRIRGLNTSGLAPRRGLALPTETIRRSVEELRAHGRVRRGYLGVGAHPVRLGPHAAAAGQSLGLIVHAIEADGPAHRGGLALGDVLLHVGGTPVGEVEELVARLGPDTVGQPLVVRFLRGGEVAEREVTVGAKP